MLVYQRVVPAVHLNPNLEGFGVISGHPMSRAPRQPINPIFDVNSAGLTNYWP